MRQSGGAPCRNPSRGARVALRIVRLSVGQRPPWFARPHSHNHATGYRTTSFMHASREHSCSSRNSEAGADPRYPAHGTLGSSRRWSVQDRPTSTRNDGHGLAEVVVLVCIPSVGGDLPVMMCFCPPLSILPPPHSSGDEAPGQLQPPSRSIATGVISVSRTVTPF